MLAQGEGNIVRRYAFWGPVKDNEKAKKSRDGLPYCYVDNGFFKLVLYPSLPFIIFGHIGYFYAVYLLYTQNLWHTLVHTFVTMQMAGLGVMAGSHRLWCHRAYEAHLPLRIVLMIWHCMSGQYSILGWVKGHRTHHKYSDTDADPHNVKRGFYFAHMGWMITKEHPICRIKGSGIDYSDILADPVAKFQEDNFLACYFVFSILLPTLSHLWWYGGSPITAFFIAYNLRYLVTWHGTLFVNSASHMFGDKPFNDKIMSAENPLVAFGSLGEGYHNYHHTYPWDYSLSEDGKLFNGAKNFIELMGFVGLAYNLKRANKDMLYKSRERVKNNSWKETTEYDWC